MTKILYFLDSDDKLSDDAISFFVEKQKNFPDAEIIQGSMVHALDGNSIDINKHSFIEDNLSIRRLFYSKDIFIIDSACDKLIKRDFLINNNLFFKEGIILEDAESVFAFFPNVHHISYYPFSAIREIIS